MSLFPELSIKTLIEDTQKLYPDLRTPFSVQIGVKNANNVSIYSVLIWWSNFNPWSVLCMSIHDLNMIRIATSNIKYHGHYNL